MKLSLFPAIFEHPEQIFFKEQEEDEIIELFLRQHWVTNVPWLFLVFLGAILPLLIVIFLPQLDILFGGPISSIFPLNYWLAITISWYLFLLAFSIESFLQWYFNIYIITNLHLIDINFYSLINQDVLEIGLENIETAAFRRQGITRSLFNYGDVIIKTAGEKDEITFLAVPFPDIVVDRINDLRVTRREDI